MYRLRLDAEPSVIGKNWNPERRYCHWLELFATPSWFYLFLRSLRFYSSKKFLPAIFGILAFLPYFCSRFPIMGYKQARRGG